MVLTDNQINYVAAPLLHFAYCAFGTLIVYLGYRLFLINLKPVGKTPDKPKDGEQTGTDENAAGLTVAYGQYKLELRNAAPGIFFALFGSFVVVASIFKGVEIPIPPEPEVIFINDSVPVPAPPIASDTSIKPLRKRQL